MRALFLLLLFFSTAISTEVTSRSFYKNFTNYTPHSHARMKTPDHSIIIRTRSEENAFCPPCPPISRKPYFKPGWGTYEQLHPTHRRPVSYRLTRETCSDSICCQPLRKDFIMRGLF